jgi:hypothetical protein
MLYHGPSQLGKSLAITSALQGRHGVLYVNLRNASSDAVATKVATGLNYLGGLGGPGGMRLKIVLVSMVSLTKIGIYMLILFFGLNFW